MPIPDTSINIKDGGLGLVPQLNNNTVALLGVCSGGVDNSVNAFGGGNTQAVADTLGTGPLVESAAAIVQAGCPVIACKVHTTTPGSQGAVTHVGTGTSVVTTTGAALDSYEALVKVTKAGTNNLGDSAFQVSLDGGLTYGPEVALPVATTYLIPGTGITLNFAAGTLVVGDTFAFTATGPAFGNTDMNTALTALLADARTWFLLELVGIPADATAMATFFGTLDTGLSGAAAKFRYARAIMSAPWGLTDAALIAGIQALSSTRVAIGADWGRFGSVLSGRDMKVPSTFEAAIRAAKIDPGVDPSRVLDGPLTGLISLNRDEAATPGLDVARYTTMRTFTGLAGFYLTNFRLASSPTSDFQYLQHGRVMDIACAIARIGFLRFLNDSVLVDKKTGLILETEARRIENYVNALERASITQPGFATDVTVVVDRTVNMITTGQLKARVSITPLAYMKSISVDVGYVNPALQAV